MKNSKETALKLKQAEELLREYLRIVGCVDAITGDWLLTDLETKIEEYFNENK